MSKIEEIAEKHVGKPLSIVGNGPTLARLPDHRAFFGRYMKLVQDRRNGIDKDINEYEVPPTTVRQLKDHPYNMWTVNGGWSYHPESCLGFLMDDHMFHSDASHPQAEWYDNLIKTSKLPIMTSKAYPDYPSLVEYPLKEVIKMFKTSYFGETIDYMCALAGYFQVSKVIFWGCDYQMHDRFPGERAGTEYWIGRLEQMGIECDASPSMNLMKVSPREGFFHPVFYGYRFDNETANDPEILDIVKRDCAQKAVA